MTSALPCALFVLSVCRPSVPTPSCCTLVPIATCRSRQRQQNEVRPLQTSTNGSTQMQSTFALRNHRFCLLPRLLSLPLSCPKVEISPLSFCRLRNPFSRACATHSCSVHLTCIVRLLTSSVCFARSSRTAPCLSLCYPVLPPAACFSVPTAEAGQQLSYRKQSASALKAVETELVA
jgi:hypothetical protein